MLDALDRVRVPVSRFEARGMGYMDGGEDTAGLFRRACAEGKVTPVPSSACCGPRCNQHGRLPTRRETRRLRKLPAGRAMTPRSPRCWRSVAASGWHRSGQHADAVAISYSSMGANGSGGRSHNGGRGYLGTAVTPFLRVAGTRRPGRVEKTKLDASAVVGGCGSGGRFSNGTGTGAGRVDVLDGSKWTTGNPSPSAGQTLRRSKGLQTLCVQCHRDKSRREYLETLPPEVAKWHILTDEMRYPLSP